MKRGILIPAVVMEGCYLAFYFVAPGAREVLMLIAAHLLSYLILTAFVWKRFWGRSWERWERRDVIAVIAFGVLFRLTLVPHAVVGSDDIYRYLWDGKVLSSGINPYAYGPLDPRLAHLSTHELPSLVNHPELRSVYPPLAQVFFAAAYTVAGASVSGFKCILVLVDCCSILLLLGLLRDVGAPPGTIALYAWSPLPILYFGLDGHIDALGIPFLLLFLRLMTKNQPFRGALSLALASLVKLTPLIAVPFFPRSLKGIKRWLAPLLAILMVAASYWIFLEPTWGIIDSLRTMGQRWEFNGGIFTIFYALVGSNETAHYVSGGLILILLASLAVIDRPIIEKVFWALTGFLLLSPVVHPWYLTWLAALLVLRWSTAVFVFLGMSVVANFIVFQYKAGEGWTDQPLLLIIEYVPVMILLVREWMCRQILPAPHSEREAS